MSILDDAIREHLELKRAHGADDVELKKLEDEAFGPPQRPGEIEPMAEAPTEFLEAPAVDGEQEAPDTSEGARRMPNIADLQEGPPAPAAPTDDAPDAPAEEPSPAAEQTMPVPHPATEEELLPGLASDPQDEAAPELPIDSGPSTEERHAIADQPTEFFDVEADIDPETPSPTDEQLIDSQISEPRLAPVDPVEGIEARGPDAEVLGQPLADEDEEDDFFSEERLSEELNNALEAPITDEHVSLPEHPPTEEHAAPFQTDEHEAGPYTDEHEAIGGTDEHEAVAGTDEHEALPASEEQETFPATDEHELRPVTDEHETTEPPSEEPTAIYDISRHNDFDDDEDEHEEPASDEHPVPRPAPGHADALEETPDFLEDAPEDDDLWFEQKPPKDFDFDD
jgi:hypothetical protein